MTNNIEITGEEYTFSFKKDKDITHYYENKERLNKPLNLEKLVINTRGLDDALYRVRALVDRIHYSSSS